MADPSRAETPSLSQGEPSPPLASKVVVLTGASRGIGRATALRLARAKPRLALCGRDAAALSEVAREVARISGHEPVARSFDLRIEEEILRFYEAVKEAFGAPDVLVNNAGYNARKVPLWEVATEELDAMMAVNLRAPFILTREAVRDMISRRSGHIVNVLSTCCHHANETMSVYTAAKRGFEGWSRVLLKEVRPHGIRVSAVYPGGTDTTFRATSRPDYLRPESVAEAIFAVLTLPEDLIVHDITFRPMAETNF